MAGAKVLGLPPPLNPTQVLWINIIMDGPPAQSLAWNRVILQSNYSPQESETSQSSPINGWKSTILSSLSDGRNTYVILERVRQGRYR